MPDITPPVQVADDIFQVRLPLPFALNHVNCYLLRGDGWTMIDTGLNTPPAQAVWRAAFASLGITPRDLEQVILTHVHPDHFGLSGWFQSLAADAGFALPVRLSRREAELAHLLWMSGRQPEKFDRFIRQCGLPPEMRATVSSSMTETAEKTLPHPVDLQPLEPDHTLSIGQREFRLIHAPGHSDGQLLLYDPADQLILSGDHVLMKITPNIGLWPDSEPDPLGHFLESLKSLQALQVRLALPGHRSLITDWHGRLAELLAHHDQRLEHTLAALDGGATVYAASLKVFNSSQFTAHEWRFAMVETLAHLEYLRLRRLVRQETIDDLWRFSLV